MLNKINQIVERFPVLTEHRKMVEFILDIRKAFKIEKVPFEIRVGHWSSGSLDKYYASVGVKNKPQHKKKTKRKGSRGWVRH